MTTVADLVAKLGFKVDDSGFNKFKNSLQAFQSLVREGIKDLKEYAKEAERISNAFKNAYIPSKKDADSRYRAEIYAMRAKAYAQRVRAKWLPEQLSIRRLNAETRERQTTLKEAGIRGGGGSLNSIAGVIGTIGGALSGGLGGFATAIASAIGGPIAGAFTAVASKIVSGIFSAISWLWSQIKAGLRYAMAFRDYRTFTGRNTTQLRNLIGMAGATTSMTQQDVLKDATQVGQAFWDMWFGGGSPGPWQLLGLLPSGNGARDLLKIITRIREVAGEERGLALNLLKQFGLSEQYMTIMYDRWEEFKQGQGNKNFVEFADEELRTYSELNEKVRNFGFALDRLRAEFVRWLEDTIGLKNVLNMITDYLKGLIIALKSGESIASIITGDPRRIAGIGKHGTYFVDSSDIQNANMAEQLGIGKGGSYLDAIKKVRNSEMGPNWLDYLKIGALTGPAGLLGALTADMVQGIKMQNAVDRVVTFNNNFDMSGKTPEEQTQGYGDILEEQMTKSTLLGDMSNATTTMAMNG